MNKDKIIERLKYNEKEYKVQMPNEIFDDISDMGFKNVDRRAFVYSYYYLILWLYRYAKYGKVKDKIIVKDIKEILGYNKNYEVIDYIIKKDGILDQMGYTKTSTDFPIDWLYEDKYLSFSMYSELYAEVKPYFSSSNNYKIKIPVKGIHRTSESVDECVEDGVYYEIDNTHMINFEVFLDIISEKEVGCKGFYVYGYIKWKCDKFKNKYNISLIRLAHEMNIHKDVLCKIVNKLIGMNLIGCYYNGFMQFDLGKGEYRKKANTFSILG